MGTMSSSANSAGVAAATPSPTGQIPRAVLDMLNQAERAIDVDPGQARIFLRQASRLLEPELSRPAPPRAPPSLTTWQERKVLTFIGEHLDQTISNGDLAAIAGLSIGHFSRCFRGSFGSSPREYLIRSRLERAKTLMRQTSARLSQIALESGFADQAHMSRLFHAIVGDTPTRWRREQTPGLPA